MSDESITNQEPSDSHFLIFDYIAEMEDRIDQIVKYAQDKAQVEYNEKQKQLEAEYSKKISALVQELEQQKQTVEEKITKDKSSFEGILQEKIQTIKNKFKSQEKAILKQILESIDLPFLK